MEDAAVDIYDVSVKGFAADEFAPLENIFARTVATDRAVGASLSVYRDGIKRVDLRARDYPHDALQVQFSVSKAVSAITAAHAESSGLIDLDEPVARYWSAFRRAETLTITPRMILSHTAGLAGVAKRLTIDQLVAGQYTVELERQVPYWEPGTRHGYHSFSFGALMDGVFRHALDMTIGDYFRSAIGDPLGLDIHYGVPPSEQHRLRPVRRGNDARTPLIRSLPTRREFFDEGAAELRAEPRLHNRADVAAQAWPGSSVVCNSESMAKLLASVIGVVDGIRSLTTDALNSMTLMRASGLDWVLQFPISYGSGVQLAFPQVPFTGGRSFGHDGAGGSVTFADPERGLSVSYVTDTFPACPGASLSAIAMFSTIRHLCDRP